MQTFPGILKTKFQLLLNLLKKNKISIPTGDVIEYIGPSGDRQGMSGGSSGHQGWPSGYVRVSSGLTWVSQGISVGNQSRLGIPQWMSGNSPVTVRGCRGVDREFLGKFRG